MSEQPGPDATAGRPRQVTMGAWVAGGCSVAMLLVVGSVITRLRSVDFRTGVASFLDDQRAAGISMSLDTALVVIRVGLMVCGAVAAAIGVFAFFAARRDRSARIAMSVLAVPMLVTGVFIDPFLAGFVVAATVLLWTSPARDWYAGRTPAPAGGPGPTQGPFSRAPIAPPPGTSPGTSPGTGTPPGQQVGPPSTWPPPPPPPSPLGPPQGPAAPLSPYGAGPGAPLGSRAPSRPVRVLVACLLATAVSALTAGAMVLTALVLQSSAARGDIEKVIRDNPSFADSGLSVDDLALASTVIAVLIAVWALVALVFAGFAMVGRRWARIALLVSTGLAGLLSLGASLAFPGFLVVTAACVLTGVLMINPDVNAWYAGRPRAPKVPPPTSPW